MPSATVSSRNHASQKYAEPQKNKPQIHSYVSRATDDDFTQISLPTGPPHSSPTTNATQTAHKWWWEQEPLYQPTKNTRPIKTPATTISVLLNGTPHILNTNVRAVFYTPQDFPIDVNPDSGSPISIGDKSLIQQRFPHSEILPLPPAERIQLSGIGTGPLVTHYTMIELRARSTDKDIVLFPATKVYLVDHLSCGMLLGVDFLKPNRLHLHWGEKDQPDHLKVGETNQVIAVSTTKSRNASHRAAQLYLTEAVTILPGEGRNLPIRHRILPPRADGYLIRPFPQADLSIGRFGSLINGITDGLPQPIPYSNFGAAPIYLPAGTCLGILEPCPIPQQQCTVLFNLTDVFEGLPPAPDDAIGGVEAGFPYLATPPREDFDLADADISNFWGHEFKSQVAAVIRKHTNLFRPELGCFNDGITMPIPFKPEADIKDLRQGAYNLSKKDQNAMDGILDPLKADGALESVPLGHPSPAASPVFVVWRNGKPRVVVDLRRVNTKMQLDAYPLPRQDTILEAMGGSTIFTSLDMTKSFFQQKLDPADKWKVAITSAHRGHEQFTVSVMGLTTTPAFFQHRMEALFGKYLWRFVLVYIDDIIIFSKTPQQHLQHLDTTLDILQNSGVTLNAAKCHFAQPSIQALGHHVSRLGLSTLEDKIQAVRQWTFPQNLKQLETALGFFGYYRRFIDHYAAIVDPLVELKTIGFRNAPSKGKKREAYAAATPLELQTPTTPTPPTKAISTVWTPELLKRCHHAFEEIKSKLCSAPILAFPDFSRPFILHVDGSKERGFGAALHQIGADNEEHPILYLSKALSSAEKNYWSTELETAALVWSLQKLPHYLDGNSFKVWTDHQAIVDSFKDKGPLNRKGPRLANWRLFLSQYASQMEIKHRPGVTNQNADALSRLPHLQDQTRAASQLESVSQQHITILTIDANPKPTPRPTPQPSTTPATADTAQTPAPQTSTTPDKADGSHLHTPETAADPPIAITTYLDRDLIRTIARSLPTDRSFKKIYIKMQQRYKGSKPNEKITTFENFRLDPRTKLLFFRDLSGAERLCIPARLASKILQMAHDDRAHVGGDRTYEYLRRHVFIPRMTKLVKEYVKDCPICKAAKPTRTLPRGLLQPIPPPPTHLSTICIDIVTSLPMSKQGHNAALIITDPLTKWVQAILGTDSYGAQDWAKAYYQQVYAIQGIPYKIISDRDPRFTSHFWEELCSHANVKLGFTAAYHAQADGQSERSIQTFVHALRCAIGGRFDQTGWEDLVPHILHVLNTSHNDSTGFTPFLLRYGTQARSPLSLASPPNAKPLTKDGAKQFVTNHTKLLAEAADAIKLAQARMKLHYDKNRLSENIAPGDKVYLKLAKGTNDGYHLLDFQTKLSLPKMGPYEVLEVVSPVSFKLDLPDWLQIHPIISIDHVELATKKKATKDLYNRQMPEPGPIHDAEGNEFYIIEKILKKEMRSTPGKRTRQPYYLCQYLGYQHKEWQPAEILEKDVPNLLRAFEERTKR